MLEHISWRTFFEFTAVGSVCWYGYLATTYYRYEIVGLFNKRWVGSQRAQNGSGTGPTAKTYWTPEGRMPYSDLQTGTGAERVTRTDDEEAELLPLPAQILSADTTPASTNSSLQQFIEQAQGLMIELAATAQTGKLKEVIAEMITSFPELHHEPDCTTAKNFLRRESRLVCNVIWQDGELDELLPTAGA